MAQATVIEPEWEEYPLNWKHIIAIVSVMLFVSMYLVVIPFKTWINRQLDFIFADWQLAFSFIFILILTLGWYVIEFIAVVIVYFHIKVMSKLTSKTTNYIRYVLITYFLSVIVIFYMFGFGVNEPLLWLTAIFFAISVSVVFYGGLSLKRKYYPKAQEEGIGLWGRMSDGVPRPRFKHFLALFIIIFVFLCVVTNTFGMMNTFGELYALINSHLILTIMFYLIILFTILWKPFLLFADLLNWIFYRVLTDKFKRKINRSRFLTLIFIVSMLIIKNLPFMELKPFEEQMISITLGFLVSILSWYLLRKMSNPLNF